MSSQYIFTMHRLSKVFPPDKTVLNEVTLAFLPGAKIGVLGYNGAGKSSLLRIMAGRDTDVRGDAQLAPGATVGLLEHADGRARRQGGLPAELLLDAGHDPKQRRLARAVVAQHADLGAREDGQCDVVEDRLVGRVDLRQAVHREDVLGGHAHAG